MGSQLHLHTVDDIEERAKFLARMGVEYTDRDRAEDMRSIVEEPGDVVKNDCGLNDFERGKGAECDDRTDDDDCLACQLYEAGKALDCGIGTKARRERKNCASEVDEGCGECRIYDERLRRDCGMPSDNRVNGKECSGEDGACSACRTAGVERDHTREFELLRSKMAQPIPDSFAAEIESVRKAYRDALESRDGWEREAHRLRAATGADAQGACIVELEAALEFVTIERDRLLAAVPAAVSPVKALSKPTEAPSLFAALGVGSTPAEPAKGPPVAKVRRWTKADVRAMTGAIDTARLTMGGPESRDGFADAFRALLAAQRTEVVLDGIRTMRAMSAERAEKNDGAAKHFREHPEVYGDSTPEMIERFAGLAVSDRKDLARADALLARIAADGLPIEAMNYDPFAVKR